MSSGERSPQPPRMSEGRPSGGRCRRRRRYRTLRPTVIRAFRPDVHPKSAKPGRFGAGVCFSLGGSATVAETRGRADAPQVGQSGWGSGSGTWQHSAEPRPQGGSHRRRHRLRRRPRRTYALRAGLHSRRARRLVRRSRLRSLCRGGGLHIVEGFEAVSRTASTAARLRDDIRTTGRARGRLQRRLAEDRRSRISMATQ